MALTFFWRCEGATLDATHDYTAGTDNDGTANASVAINGTAALVGSNGIQVTGAGDQYRFATETTVHNRLTGSVGFWLRVQTWVENAVIFSIGGSSYQYTLQIAMFDVDELRFRINEDAGVSLLPTTAANLATNTTYFVTFSWDQPNDDRRLRVYDATGTLIQEVEDTATAFTAPADLVAATGMRIGEGSGAASAFYLDNIFIGDAYADADTFLTNRSITSYTDYNGGGSGGSAIAAKRYHHAQQQG